jgi:plastocyanin
MASDAGAEGGAEPSEAGAPVPVVAEVATGTVHGSVITKPASVAANAVIYLEDAPIEASAKMNVTIDNHQMLFTPFVAVIPTGGRVTFHNSDPFPHNVFSSDHERFDMGAIPNGQGRVRAFKNAGAYALLCNLHPGMLGYVLVTPSSYFAKADGKGHYTMKNVPNGTYKITAWAPRQEPATQSVTVKGNDVSVDFDLHR